MGKSLSPRSVRSAPPLLVSRPAELAFHDCSQWRNFFACTNRVHHNHAESGFRSILVTMTLPNYVTGAHANARTHSTAVSLTIYGFIIKRA